jgi:hypothetical protein
VGGTRCWIPASGRQRGFANPGLVKRMRQTKHQWSNGALVSRFLLFVRNSRGQETRSDNGCKERDRRVFPKDLSRRRDYDERACLGFFDTLALQGCASFGRENLIRGSVAVTQWKEGQAMEWLEFTACKDVRDLCEARESFVAVQSHLEGAQKKIGMGPGLTSKVKRLLRLSPQLPTFSNHYPSPSTSQCIKSHL